MCVCGEGGRKYDLKKKRETGLFNKSNWTMTDMAKGTQLININSKKPSNPFIQGIDGHFT